MFVPFEAPRPRVAAVLGGDVQVTFVSMGAAYRIRAPGQAAHPGRRHAAARGLRARRADLRRAGFPGFETTTWFALFAPRGTPKEIVDQLNGYVRELAEDADAKKRLAANFVDPAVMTAADFAELVKTDAAKWERIVREAGVKID